MSRIVVLVGVLLVMLLVPLFLNKEREGSARQKARAADAAERAVDAKSRVPPAPTGPADPDRLGLTFGWSEPADDGRLVASCRGQPPSALAGPTPGECDARAGDTLCRTTLPLLCVRAAEGGAFEIATTEGVPGFALASLAAADARCGELGAAWRLARYRAANGLAVIGRRGDGLLAATHQRAWVAGDGGWPANCWDALSR